MDLKTTVDQLHKAIYRPSIFYIPYALFPELSEESLIELEAMAFFNTLAVMNDLGDVGTFKNSDSLNIMVKATTLRRNVLQLLEMKAHLQQETFKMVLDDYWSTLHIWDHIYDWLRNNVEADIPTIKSTTATLFTYQSDAIKAHLTQLQEQFQPSQAVASIDRKELIERNKNLIPLDQTQFVHIFKTSEADPIFKDDATLKPKRKKKIILPTVQEVDDFILKAVFKVNLDGRSNNAM